MLRPSAHFLGATLGVAILALCACDKPKDPPSDSARTPANDGADEGVTPPPGEPPPAESRRAAIPSDHPLHARFEGTDFPNDCKADTDCHASGCSGEVCSADSGVITTCDVPMAPLPEGTECGCVSSQCIWWNADGKTLPVVDPTPGDPPPSEAGGLEAGGAEVGEAEVGEAEVAEAGGAEAGEAAPDEAKPDGASPTKPRSPASPRGDCGGKVCKPPKKCIEYYGIAGPRGPKLQSCEIPCAPGKKEACPKGMKCTTIADGPGSVCR